MFTQKTRKWGPSASEDRAYQTWKPSFDSRQLCGGTTARALRRRGDPPGEFLHLLFSQAHRETTAHFTAIGMPSQQRCDSFRYRRAAFYNGLKSKVGLAAAKAAALRVNLNITGCSIVAPPARPSRSSHASLIDSMLSHSLPELRA